ncbi:hypothetical protein GGTG_04658 [Gaeumannomyces tritici R3-111a-1]|uniref:non-specific serine/threonine protein kinase n=1 Tax=Gaeumannomyces tritici (strain R3-111a-1) TaxID=644352 RepID=J3NTQ8_GAET3|nr:hypothetical protein GGTG_04658 [Gaeumannomyces tritici R3-111a-1]EJT79573.1 hypothetical protein GGTG_04658 [Gaeumannomyces tritici R3-111a-1]
MAAGPSVGDAGALRSMPSDSPSQDVARDKDGGGPLFGVASLIGRWSDHRSYDQHDPASYVPFSRHPWWEPPAEPYRPSNPYRPGLKLAIYRHEPPPPLRQMGHEPYPDPFGMRSAVHEALKKMTLVDLCLAHPPMEGVAHEDDTHQLQVVEEIAVQDDHGAQVVVCRLDDDPTKTYVAKVFDPLYYMFNEVPEGHYPRDTVFHADADYSCEAAAFEELKNTRLPGKEIPDYHGCWTFNISLELPAPQGIQVRAVRLVLMEHIDGAITMLDADPDEYSDDSRLDIVARVFEAEAACINRGILHGDVSPRNVLIKNSSDPESDHAYRVVLLDFNMAEIIRPRRPSEFKDDPGDHGDSPRASRQYGPTRPPVHPARRMWNSWELFLGEFHNWMPRTWKHSQRQFNEWLLTQWGNSAEWKTIWEVVKDTLPPHRDSPNMSDEEREDSPEEGNRKVPIRGPFWSLGEPVDISDTGDGHSVTLATGLGDLGDPGDRHSVTLATGLGDPGDKGYASDDELKLREGVDPNDPDDPDEPRAPRQPGHNGQGKP